MLFLVNLPDVIIKYLLSFLSNDDIRYFLSSKKLHFSSLKQETIYLSLNKEKTREYVENERFRETILSKVKDGRKQIGLTFNETLIVHDISDIVAHRIVGMYFTTFPVQVSSLVCCLSSGIEKIPFLPALQDLKLNLINCLNIRDVCSLSHLRRLKLSHAYQVTDITPLENIPHLSLINCPSIRDFSVLSSERQRFLSLERSSITDVSSLRNILTVEIIHSIKLIDVSPLHGIKNLLLHNCSSIQDISCLGNHHRLTISNCNSISRGYECFRTVRHAEVARNEVPDLTVFRDAKSLRITFFKSMESQLFLLRDIPDLSLISSFSHDKEVYDVSQVRNMRLSFQRDIIKIGDSNLPSQLLHLELVGCDDQIVKILNEGKTSIFHQLQSLHIKSCSIEHVNGLGEVPTLILENCLELHDISGLGRNRCVELRSCPKISDVSSLATVPIVTLKNCARLVDYSCLISSVSRLKVVRSN